MKKISTRIAALVLASESIIVMPVASAAEGTVQPANFYNGDVLIRSYEPENGSLRIGRYLAANEKIRNAAIALVDPNQATLAEVDAEFQNDTLSTRPTWAKYYGIVNLLDDEFNIPETSYDTSIDIEEGKVTEDSYATFYFAVEFVDATNPDGDGRWVSEKVNYQYCLDSKNYDFNRAYCVPAYSESTIEVGTGYVLYFYTDKAPKVEKVENKNESESGGATGGDAGNDTGSGGVTGGSVEGGGTTENNPGGAATGGNTGGVTGGNIGGSTSGSVGSNGANNGSANNTSGGGGNGVSSGSEASKTEDENMVNTNSAVDNNQDNLQTNVQDAVQASQVDSMTMERTINDTMLAQTTSSWERNEAMSIVDATENKNSETAREEEATDNDTKVEEAPEIPKLGKTNDNWFWKIILGASIITMAAGGFYWLKKIKRSRKN